VGILVGYGPLFVQGLLMTLQLTVVSITGGLVLGVVLGLVSSTVDSPPPRSRSRPWRGSCCAA
jgi:polar amino acid transport system permease protein